MRSKISDPNHVMKILILGVGGFIGSELSGAILNETDWEVYGLDINQNKIEEFLGNSRFYFKLGDINRCREWVVDMISKCDAVIPLAAIATPMSYVKDPLGVFHLVFETNLWIIKECTRLKKRIIFPSTSEVYGMSSDAHFHESSTSLVLGPIEKERWIYSCSKQLLDRVIWASGREGLPFTIFRPFNWIGHSQDSINTDQKGSARVLTQFIGNIFRGEPLLLVDGGRQLRSFTDIRDGVSALMAILRNQEGRADNKIFNIGNPRNNVSIREIATILTDVIGSISGCGDLVDGVCLKDVSTEEYYGKGYQDVPQRVPDISEISSSLGWSPRISLRNSIEDIVLYHINFRKKMQIA